MKKTGKRGSGSGSFFYCAVSVPKKGELF